MPPGKRVPRSPKGAAAKRARPRYELGYKRLKNQMLEDSKQRRVKDWTDKLFKNLQRDRLKHPFGWPEKGT